MAKQKIVLSNGDGKVILNSTSSLSVDDVTNNISASYISASAVAFSSVAPTSIGILSASNGALTTFPAGTVMSGAIAWDGTKWIASGLQVNDYTGEAVGDLSGNYSGYVQVKNISNVNSGALPVNYGGTGTSIPVGNYILKASGSTISGLGGFASGSILTSTNGVFEVNTPAWKPNVQIFTTPGSFTWKKPQNARFARVITQGGGGSGGNGTRQLTGLLIGGGGAGGGLAEATFDVSNISSAIVTVGAGGAQPSGTIAAGTYIAGNAGGQSSFTATGISIYGNGGAAGPVGSATVAAAVGGTSGGGSTLKTGGSSNSYNTINSTNDVVGGGGVGGAYTGTSSYSSAPTITKILNINGVYGYDYNLIANTVPTMSVTGGVGGNPTVNQSNIYDDPYVLLHMKPFYENKVDIVSTSSYSPAMAYTGSAGWTTASAPFAGGTSLAPRLYSINNTYDTGSITITPGYNLTSSNFTWESWIYLNSTGSNAGGAGDRMYLIDSRNAVSSANKYAIYTATGGKLGFYAGTGASSLLTSSAAVPTGSWQHIALVRSAGSFRFYINGTQDANTYTAAWSLTDATNITFGNSTLAVAQQLSLDGYMSNIRLSNTARYSGNYTIPTESFSNDSNTILLINGPQYSNAISNQTVDSSYYGRQVTFNGAANLTQSLTAFGDTAYVLSPMSATNKTGSITVSSGDDIGTRDFTVESWVYLNSSGSNKDINLPNGMRGYFVDTRVGSVNNSTRYAFTLHDNAKIGLYIGGSATMSATSSLSISLNQWSHISLVRKDGIANFYINGQKDIASASWASSLNNTVNGMTIGSHAIGTTNFTIDGYIDEFRITPKALYTASFTPSTTRFSDPYNPLLLMHMEPSGSYTATADSSKLKSNIYFQGVQSQATTPTITNTVGSPFSNSGNSILLSGSATSSPALTVVGAPVTRTEPFTFECWVYRKDNANAIDSCIFDTRATQASAGGIYAALSLSGQIKLYSNNAYFITSNLSVPLRRWTHIAIVRNGVNGNSCFYIDGIRDTKNFTISSTYNLVDTRMVLGSSIVTQGYTTYGYLDEIRLSKAVLYTGSTITVPTAPFPDPTGFSYTFPGEGSDGIYGSGGGGGGSTIGHSQELNRGYLAGKGGDGYVAVISW